MHVPTVVEVFWLLFRSFWVIGEQLLLKAKPMTIIQEKGKWVYPSHSVTPSIYVSQDITWDG